MFILRKQHSLNFWSVYLRREPYNTLCFVRVNCGAPPFLPKTGQIISLSPYPTLGVHSTLARTSCSDISRIIRNARRPNLPDAHGCLAGRCLWLPPLESATLPAWVLQRSSRKKVVFDTPFNSAPKGRSQAWSKRDYFRSSLDFWRSYLKPTREQMFIIVWFKNYLRLHCLYHWPFSLSFASQSLLENGRSVCLNIFATLALIFGLALKRTASRSGSTVK